MNRSSEDLDKPVFKVKDPVDRIYQIDCIFDFEHGFIKVLGGPQAQTLNCKPEVRIPELCQLQRACCSFRLHASRWRIPRCRKNSPPTCQGSLASRSCRRERKLTVGLQLDEIAVIPGLLVRLPPQMALLVEAFHDVFVHGTLPIAPASPALSLCCHLGGTAWWAAVQAWDAFPADVQCQYGFRQSGLS